VLHSWDGILPDLSPAPVTTPGEKFLSVTANTRRSHGGTENHGGAARLSRKKAIIVSAALLAFFLVGLTPPRSPRSTTLRNLLRKRGIRRVIDQGKKHFDWDGWDSWDGTSDKKIQYKPVLKFIWLFIPCIPSIPVKWLLFFTLVVEKIKNLKILVLSCASCCLHPVYPVQSFVLHFLTPEQLLKNYDICLHPVGLVW
jgi:hypothetical protein